MNGPNNCPSKAGTVAGFAAATNLHGGVSRGNDHLSALSLASLGRTGFRIDTDQSSGYSDF